MPTKKKTTQKKTVSRKPAASRKKASGAPPLNEELILDVGMDILANEGWAALTAEAIGDRLGVKADLVRGFVANQVELLALLGEQVNAAMHAGGPVEGSGRDKLFELLMRRYEALQPYRKAVANVVAAVPEEPFLPLLMTPVFNIALEQILERADLPSGPLHRLGLGMAAALAFRVWLEDEGADLAKTMAELDRRLSQLEEVAEFLRIKT